jgi:hypothetical protein
MKAGSSQTPKITSLEILNGDHINVNDPIYIRGYLAGNFSSDAFILNTNNSEIFYDIEVIEDNSVFNKKILEYHPKVSFGITGNPYTENTKLVQNTGYPGTNNLLAGVYINGDIDIYEKIIRRFCLNNSTPDYGIELKDHGLSGGSQRYYLKVRVRYEYRSNNEELTTDWYRSKNFKISNVPSVKTQLNTNGRPQSHHAIKNEFVMETGVEEGSPVPLGNMNI